MRPVGGGGSGGGGGVEWRRSTEERSPECTAVQAVRAAPFIKIQPGFFIGKSNTLRTYYVIHVRFMILHYGLFIDCYGTDTWTCTGTIMIMPRRVPTEIIASQQ